MFLGRGYREFQLFHAGGELKQDWQDISSINTVPYPKDLMRLIEVGVLIGGEMFPFTRADRSASISNPTDLVRTEDESSTLYRAPTYGYTAKGHNAEYYYHEEKDKRRIVLSRMALDVARYEARSKVLFRYVSDGLNDLNQVVIAADAANLLMAYIEYKLIQARPEKYNAQYRMEKKEEYIEQQRMYDALNMPSIWELEDVIYANSGQSVRRL